MRSVAIIQARMGSKRLPGKSMADLAGHPLLWQLLQRAKRATSVDEMVLATTTGHEDDVLCDVAEQCGVRTFRGSQDDLIDRYYQAALKHGATVVVRLCADNPVVEPEEIDRIVEYHNRGGSDFSANTHDIMGNGYPDGLGAEVFGFQQLAKIWRVTTDPRNREHPHTYFYEHPEEFRIGTIPCPSTFRRPDLKLDVNTADELRFLRAVYEHCYPRKHEFHITDVIEWYDNVYLTKLPSRVLKGPPAH